MRSFDLPTIDPLSHRHVDHHQSEQRSALGGQTVHRPPDNLSLLVGDDLALVAQSGVPALVLLLGHPSHHSFHVTHPDPAQEESVLNAASKYSSRASMMRRATTLTSVSV